MFAKCPAGCPGTADEAANVAELLMSNKGAFITGADFLIDGGATASYFLPTLNEQEEILTDKIISAIADYIQIEPMQVTPASVLSFPGLEIIQSGRRVLQDGKEVSLTRLEYSTLLYLASNPGIVLTRTHILEAVWSMAAIQALPT